MPTEDFTRARDYQIFRVRASLRGGSTTVLGLSIPRTAGPQVVWD
jgi:hypothetical protein